MKTHFNKWRSFLVEQENKTTKELERKFYGTDIEDLAESLYSTYLRISESEYNTVEENAIRTLEEIEGKFIFKQIKVLGSGSWRNTNAITSLRFYSNYDLGQYSQFALYGIKG